MDILEKILQNNNKAILECFENWFNESTDKWPSIEDVANHFSNDTKFVIVYKELYYRHLCTVTDVTIDQRIDSLLNYTKLYNYIRVGFQLPKQWLWDIFDGFINQCQSINQWNLENPYTYKHHGLLNAHQKFSFFEFHLNHINLLPEYLKYFILVGYLKLNSLLRKYNIALEVIKKIQFDSGTDFEPPPSCQMTAYYHMGFTYMMLDRHVDAIMTFTKALLYIEEKKSKFEGGCYLYDMIEEQSDQIMILLAMCLVQYPMIIHRNLYSKLIMKFGKCFIKITNTGELSQFKTYFEFAFPKVIFEFPLKDEKSLENKKFQEIHQLQYQKALFEEKVEKQNSISVIRSGLKGYINISIDKFAKSLSKDPSNVKTQLMFIKSKFENMPWVDFDEKEDFQSNSDLQFTIEDEDVIRVNVEQLSWKWGECFLNEWYGQHFKKRGV